MESKHPDPHPELVMIGVTPLQSFVSRAIPLPPGTPAKPRPDRPAFVEPKDKSTEIEKNCE